MRLPTHHIRKKRSTLDELALKGFLRFLQYQSYFENSPERLQRVRDVGRQNGYLFLEENGGVSFDDDGIGSLDKDNTAACADQVSIRKAKFLGEAEYSGGSLSIVGDRRFWG